MVRREKNVNKSLHCMAIGRFIERQVFHFARFHLKIAIQRNQITREIGKSLQMSLRVWHVSVNQGLKSHVSNWVLEDNLLATEYYLFSPGANHGWQKEEVKKRHRIEEVDRASEGKARWLVLSISELLKKRHNFSKKTSNSLGLGHYFSCYVTCTFLLVRSAKHGSVLWWGTDHKSIAGAKPPMAKVAATPFLHFKTL